MEAMRGYWRDVLGDGRGILVHYICKEILAFEMSLFTINHLCT